MNEQEITNKLDVIISMADALKNEATSLRNKLERSNAPAPKGKKQLSPEIQAKIILNRTKRLKAL